MTSKILLLLILAFIFAGCGQSGPLYVPGDPSAVETPDDDEDKDDNGENDSP